MTSLGRQADPFIRHLYAALAEKERALISDRTKAGLQAAKRRGGFVFMATGPIPQVGQTASVAGASFWTENPRRQLNIMQNPMTFSDSGYVSFEEFLKQLKLATAIVAAKLDSRVVRKVGLRKINSIRIDSVQDLSEAVAVFNPVLFSAPPIFQTPRARGSGGYCPALQPSGSPRNRIASLEIPARRWYKVRPRRGDLIPLFPSY